MTRQDAVGFAQRLYARLPEHYRLYDAQQGQPLLALLTVVGEQASNLRADLDALWDNFFIETCEDWVVPYLGALAGTNMLARSVGQSDRLNVWNTVEWRRTKGTPSMLASLAGSISGWPADVVEFLPSLGWSQNVNHVRNDRPISPDLRHPEVLGLLNRVGDTLAHAADFRPAPMLAEPRGRAASAGRHSARNIGVFVKRLQMFPLNGVNPAASAPGTVPPANNACFSFNPLFREAPLFSAADGNDIRRTDFAAAPWRYFGNGRDIAVRQNGVLLAVDAPPNVPQLTPPAFATFDFGKAAVPLALDASAGIRLLTRDLFAAGAAQFILNARWSGANPANLGALDTRTGEFKAGGTATSPGQLQIRITPAPGSRSTFFPGAVIAIRAKSGSQLRGADGLYVYLPRATAPADLDISADGSSFSAGKLVRSAEGQIFPPRLLTHSSRPADRFLQLHRKSGLALTEPSRYGAQVQFAASVDHNLLSITLKPSTVATAIPPAEMIVTNRQGQALLVYLPEIAPAPAGGVSVFVAEDGSTYFVPAEADRLFNAQTRHTLVGLTLARPSAGQTLPIAGIWPLQQRTPVAMDLCSPLRATMLAPGQLGIDLERGRFALPVNDPALASGKLTVDFVEALTGPVGALAYDQQNWPLPHANLVVSASGDADTESAVHTTLASAIGAARDGDVIEIADSATYPSQPIVLNNAAVKRLTIRAAAGSRPVLLFYAAGGAPAPSSLTVGVPMAALEIRGILLSGGAIVVPNPLTALRLDACSLDPEAGSPAIVCSDANAATGGVYTLSRCITGAIQATAGVNRLIMADSIADAKGGLAISTVGSVQMERVTVIGKIAADVLTASECLLDGLATLEDRQSGCVRFSRIEAGSVLPRVYQCVPSDEQMRRCSKVGRCFAPAFHSRRFGRPDYLQLTASCPGELLRASESGAEPGAFATAMATIRLANLRSKLEEFLPIGLKAVIIAGH